MMLIRSEDNSSELSVKGALSFLTYEMIKQ